MRVSVPLDTSWRLFNHGPVTLVTAAADGAENVMAAAWVTPMDFDPPRFTVVLATGSRTRELAEASGELVLQVPTRDQLHLIDGVGSCSGRDTDKWAAFGIEKLREPGVQAPLVGGCSAWMACRVLAEPRLAQDFDLFLVQGFAAWADERVYDGSRRRADVPEGLRSVHHVSGGTYVLEGGVISVRPGAATGA